MLKSYHVMASSHTHITVTSNERYGVSNHMQLDIWFNSFFSKLASRKHGCCALLALCAQPLDTNIQRLFIQLGHSFSSHINFLTWPCRERQWPRWINMALYGVKPRCLCVGNPPVFPQCPHKGKVIQKAFPFYEFIMIHDPSLLTTVLLIFTYSLNHETETNIADATEASVVRRDFFFVLVL